jgi:hypothetical protein
MQVLEEFKTIEQGIMRAEDVTRLNFIDFKRTNGLWRNDIMAAIRTASNMLAGTTAYTVAELDLRAFPDRDDWPGWDHIGNHPYLGRLYWNFFFYNFEGQSPQLTMRDSPDFTGSFIDSEGVERTIYGDIGQVSVACFVCDAFRCLHAHDLWISVLDECRQIILEPQMDIGSAYDSKLEEMFGI